MREASDLHKRYHLQQSFTKLLKALHGFFLGSRLDETIDVPVITAIDNTVLWQANVCFLDYLRLSRTASLCGQRALREKPWIMYPYIGNLTMFHLESLECVSNVSMAFLLMPMIETCAMVQAK